MEAVHLGSCLRQLSGAEGKKISSWIDDEIMKQKMGINGFSRCISICNSVNSIPEVKEKTILINMNNF